MLFRTLILKASSWKPVKSIVTKSFLFRPMVSRFIAGETLDQAMDVAESLAKTGLKVTLDLLGENVESTEEANQSRMAYEEIVLRIAQSEYRDNVNISIKLTALGLDQGVDVAETNFNSLLALAEPHNIFVRVDMEASDYTQRTIEMIERVFPIHRNTGTVLQSYLKRTQSDVDSLIALGCRLRIVKGAYLEPEEIAFKEKSTVDAKYVAAAKNLLVNGNYPAIATHDESIINELKAFVEVEKIDKSRFEWQMLYGIRRDLQESLLKSGYNVRVYVPYGSQWYPYFSRRLAERPANMFFIVKSLLRK